MKGHEFYPGSGRGAVRPAGCARGVVLRRTVVPLEGATSETREEEKPSSPC
jgi:hypothetical protein